MEAPNLVRTCQKVNTIQKPITITYMIQIAHEFTPLIISFNLHTQSSPSQPLISPIRSMLLPHLSIRVSITMIKSLHPCEGPHTPRNLLFFLINMLQI
jgi:hypothetical protein